MRQPLCILAGLALSTMTWALTPQQDPNFVPCEKTYITPQEVILEENTIHIETGTLSGKTSAIYSDFTGLYYQDLLKDVKEESIAFEDYYDEEMFLIYSDELLPIFNDEPLVLIPDEPFIIEDEPLIAQDMLPIPEPAPIVQAIQEDVPLPEVVAKPIARLQPPPSRQPSSWPYCEKQR